MKKVGFIVVLLVIFSFIKTEASKIRDIRYGYTTTRTRVVIEFNELPEYKIGILRNPERIYFDLKDTSFNFSKKSFSVDKGVVKKIRIGRYKDNILRIVLDLTKITKYKIFVLKTPPRLVIDLNKDSKELFFIKRKKIVVIDPGHGGRDPGAIGPRGLKEKDVVLDIAKRLKKILEEQYNLKVYLTRRDDRFLPLKARTRFANRKKADVFVSIHINASKRRRACGIETYLLNWTNDKEALRVAARENAISVEKMKKSKTELGMILASLERDSKRDESLRLAYYIHSSLISKLTRSYKGIKNLGVKQALFYVLVGATMPSVLVEVGFISNPKEERLLRSYTFRQKAASAIAKGIVRYIKTLPDIPKLAMVKKK